MSIGVIMEADFEEIESERSWQRAFFNIKISSLKHDYTTEEAKKVENRPLNRYRDVHPYDHSRVVLLRSESDYINANIVPVKRAGREYILTQGPLPETLSQFWLMVWEQNTKGIVMLNKLIEKNLLKCHKYWPDKDNLEMNFESVALAVSFVSESAKDSYICRTFRLVDGETGNGREVFQFHYMNWPDFGVPQSPDDFLDFLSDVRRSGCLESHCGPAIVHCSAGIGRSGTFCLVDSILQMIEHNHLHESEINLREVLLEMRRYRMSLVQAPEQLRFSYLAIIEALRRRDGRSPYLSRKKDEDAPPPPPHRARPVMAMKTVVNYTEDSSSEDDVNEHDVGIDEERNANGNDAIGREPPEELEGGDEVLKIVTNSGESPADSACASADASESDSDSESDSGPPPLPPKDIPMGELSGTQPQREPPQSPLPTDRVLPNLSEDLHSFEKEILAKEWMRDESITLPGGNQTPNFDQEMLIRKRLHEQKIQQKVQAIKKGVKDAEAANDRRTLFENIGIGVVVFLGAGILLYRIIDYVRS
ncbi:tyrosine-protein phosphatase non-receptor type 2 [Galendromus occidentalis]|uniref:protein-tyrosine-phosphatase n=1 Tax=Galendromus occidentalis TaxID=34638 RepID=A0AAJ7L5S2_9ACAR|nr:tyrosine-protein phosphatase non-receptor type 2 [Galendromus occidentalis]